MAHRTFTLGEANAALEELRPVAQEMVELRARQRAEARLLEGVKAGMAEVGTELGDTYVPELERLRGGLARCVDTILEAGAQVKDLDTGLLDFPTLRDGEEVLLCWRVGETEIGYWHGLEEGFAGRKPLDGVE